MPYKFKCPQCGDIQNISGWKVAFNPHLILLLLPKSKPVEGVDRALLKCPTCGKRDYQKYLGKGNAIPTRYAKS